MEGDGPRWEVEELDRDGSRLVNYLGQPPGH